MTLEIGLHWEPGAGPDTTYDAARNHSGEIAMALPAVPEDLSDLVSRALSEDVGTGDLTAGLIPAQSHSTATVVVREQAIVCGRPWFDEVFAQLDPAVAVSWAVTEGQAVTAGRELCRLAGPARSILTGERTALNFLQLRSGTATRAAAYAAALSGTRCQLLDTRKTLPGLRAAQKYAVACGGGRNHRMGLYDAILIKENHILAAGSIAAAVSAARSLHPRVSVEVEVEDADELRQALAAGPDIIMLDNFGIEDMRAAVAEVAGRVRLEASGNVNLETIAAIAATGVDYVSAGTITKDVRAIDLSMRFRL